MEDPYPVPLSYKSIPDKEPFTTGVIVIDVSPMPAVINLKSTEIFG